MDINDFTTTASADDGNIVTIFTKKVINNFKSKEADELIYDFLPYLEIVSPGQRHSIVVRKIEEDDKKYKEEQIKESVANTTGNVIKVNF